MTAPSKPTPYYRPVVAPAPHLTKNGRCSECNIEAVMAADDGMKVCPSCFGVLWHHDAKAEQERQKKAAAIAAARIFAQVKTKAEAKEMREAQLAQVSPPEDANGETSNSDDQQA